MRTLRGMLGAWFAPLLIHNHNQQTAMMRAAAAQAQGLDPAVYGVPLPGSNVTTTTNNTGGGLLKGAVLAAALLTAGGLGTAGLGKVLAPSPGAAPTTPAATTPAAPVAPAVTTPAAPTVPGEDVYDIPWTMGPDGKLRWGAPKKVTP